MALGPIRCYDDFKSALMEAGFSATAEGGEGVFSLSDAFAPNIAWHTDDPETDPWQWRIRIMAEEEGVAYGKFFLRKGGFITRAWAPYFYALRRQGLDLSERYEQGQVSRLDLQIHTLTKAQPHIPYFTIKQHTGAKGLDGALTRLQAGMHIQISGQTRHLSKALEPYGWPVNTFCTTEAFWGPEVLAQAEALSPEAAEDALRAQIRRLNPGAREKDIARFLRA